MNGALVQQKTCHKRLERKSTKGIRVAVEWQNCVNDSTISNQIMTYSQIDLLTGLLKPQMMPVHSLSSS